MDIHVIGTGMYSTGRNTDGFGTILPAIIEWKRSGGEIGKVYVSGTDSSNSKQAKAKIDELQQIAGIKIDVETYPFSGKNNSAYKTVLNKVNKDSCAIIAVPDHLHYKITKDCLNKGLHCLVVKPLTSKTKEAKSLIDIAKKKNLYGAVEFHKRWDRQNLLARDYYRSGKLGDLLYTWTEYSQRKSIPFSNFKSWSDKTNIFQYLGVHYVDIVYFITGAIPQRLIALGQKNWLKKNGIDAYDSIQSIIEWKTKDNKIFTQTLLVNWVDPEKTTAMSDQKINFVGTNGRLDCNQKDRGLSFVGDENPSESINPDFCKSITLPNKKLSWNGYGIESINCFLSDVKALNDKIIKINKLKKFRPSFENSLISTKVIEAVYKSLSEKSNWIQI